MFKLRVSVADEFNFDFVGRQAKAGGNLYCSRVCIVLMDQITESRPTSDVSKTVDGQWRPSAATIENLRVHQVKDPLPNRENIEKTSPRGGLPDVRFCSFLTWLAPGMPCSADPPVSDREDPRNQESLLGNGCPRAQPVCHVIGRWWLFHGRQRLEKVARFRVAVLSSGVATNF